MPVTQRLERQGVKSHSETPGRCWAQRGCLSHLPPHVTSMACIVSGVKKDRATRQGATVGVGVGLRPEKGNPVGGTQNMFWNAREDVC